MTFNLFPTTNKEIRDLIQVCQRMNHVQQVAYSTYHDCLTQVCFNCKMIRTSMKAEDYNKYKKYMIKNVQFTKEEYEAWKKNLI